MKIKILVIFCTLLLLVFSSCGKNKDISNNGSIDNNSIGTGIKDNNSVKKQILCKKVKEYDIIDYKKYFNTYINYGKQRELIGFNYTDSNGKEWFHDLKKNHGPYNYISDEGNGIIIAKTTITDNKGKIDIFYNNKIESITIDTTLDRYIKYQLISGDIFTIIEYYEKENGRTINKKYVIYKNSEKIGNYEYTNIIPDNDFIIGYKDGKRESADQVGIDVANKLNAYKIKGNIIELENNNNGGFLAIINNYPDNSYNIIKDGIIVSTYQGFKDGRESFRNRLGYSFDNKSYYYVTNIDNKKVVIKDGVEIGKYYEISEIKYSPNKTDLYIYPGNMEDGFEIYKNDKKSGIKGIHGLFKMNDEINFDSNGFLINRNSLVNQLKNPKYKSQIAYNYFKEIIPNFEGVSEYIEPNEQNKFALLTSSGNTNIVIEGTIDNYKTIYKGENRVKLEYFGQNFVIAEWQKYEDFASRKDLFINIIINGEKINYEGELINYYKENENKLNYFHKLGNKIILSTCSLP